MESETCTLTYTQDADGKELLLKDGKFQVMMEWEKPYMEAVVDFLSPHGDVLEIGFGCGYSANRFQTYPIHSHTIIEYHPTVFSRAQTWAKDKPNVHLVHDTWQNALPSLQIFDTIFFDDYPLESEKKMKEKLQGKKRAIPLLQKGQKLLSSVKSQFQDLQKRQYKDEDLNFFFTHMQKKKTEPEHLLKFLSNLQNQEQISQTQYQQSLKRLLEENFITESQLQAFLSKKALCPFRNSHDRFLQFLKICLDHHTRPGSKISCFIEDPKSKYEDEKFCKTILENPYLDYKEKRIPITPSPHCDYYKEKEALLILITKL